MDHDTQQRNPFIFTLPEPLPHAEFISRISELSSSGYSPLGYFGTPEREILCLMGKAQHVPILLRTAFPAGHCYPSLSVTIPAFHIFERELWEEHGITPEGHPWLKPLRYPAGSPTKMESYPFFSSPSQALHEVGVGPVHAGVIEPGHFRFICQGESIQHLEIQLGYQHRGLPKLMANGDLRSKINLSEAIAGDSAIGHGLAYCLATEALCGAEPGSALKTPRRLALELERIAMHLADLSALAGDIAYLSGQNFFAALRTTIINSSLAICGSRFGKRWLCPGGINYGLNKEQNKTLRTTLLTAEKQIELSAKAMFSSSGVLNRFDSTGCISRKTAQELNMTGITAKAAGLPVDVRADFPAFEEGIFQAEILASGDVYARAYLRYKEIRQSLQMIDFWLSTLPDVKADAVPLAKPRPNLLALSLVEGWRGRIAHIVKTDQKGNTEFYRIIDPSLHNWFALALAVRNEGISDFPLCNKSFDLSYCGHDL